MQMHASGRRWLRPQLAAVAMALVALSACSSASENSATIEPVVPDESTTTNSVPDAASSDVLSASAMTLTEEQQSKVREAASSYYGSVAPEESAASEEIDLKVGVRFGQSDCDFAVTQPNESSANNLLRLFILPDGEVLVKDKNTMDQVLSRCFFDAGLTPSASDVAFAAVSMWTSSAMLERVEYEVPADVIAGLSDDLIADNLLDFEAYTGAVDIDVDGLTAVRFVASDRFDTWYLVTAFASPERSEIESVSVIYSG